MVLQRGQPIHLWGWADAGEQVKATLRGTSASTKADKLGRWSVYLPEEKAGGPYQVTISGTNTIVLDDVLIGDVWFASGQSNMQLPLIGFPHSAVVTNAEEEIRNATNPNLRLLLRAYDGGALSAAGPGCVVDVVYSRNGEELFGGGLFLRARDCEQRACSGGAD